ncbi:MAG: hypothetical protein B1H07_02400 [Campylobacteraceae bacterium 4484_166]|nr:MAG: hypothetical protein B1H07_02400 [Campylobacteraceae bacterium 4484_166]
MITVDIEKRFNDFLLDVSFDIRQGEFVAISGLSGSGKTTLLRTIAGLTKSSGTIASFNNIWQDKTTFVPAYKRALGFVSQEYTLFPNMSVIDNLLYAKKDAGLAKYLLETADMFKYQTVYPDNLSGGQKQRVAVCRALMNKPKLLLLDEPFSSLDNKTAQNLQYMIKKFHKKFDTTTLMVTHNITEVYTLASRNIILDDGLIINDYEINDVLSYSLSKKPKVTAKAIDFRIIDGKDVIVYEINKQLVVSNGQNIKKDEKVNMGIYSISPTK